MKALHFHMVSLQKNENSGIHTYIKCLESILTIPSTSYNKQVKENKRLVNHKKLSNKIIMAKSTEDTVMELDREGVANYEQLKDLIHKECYQKFGIWHTSGCLMVDVPCLDHLWDFQKDPLDVGQVRCFQQETQIKMHHCMLLGLSW